MTTLTTPQSNLLYKSNAQAKSIDYYVAEERSHTDEHKRIIIYTYGAILRSEIATEVYTAKLKRHLDVMLIKKGGNDEIFVGCKYYIKSNDCEYEVMIPEELLFPTKEELLKSL